MGAVLGTSRTVRARKQHNCFLCSVVISIGTPHLTWTWLEDRPTTMRCHAACNSYAHDRIDNWTNGDGCDEDAVETDLHEELALFGGASWSHLTGFNETEAAKIIATWPDLASVVAKVRAEILERVAEDEG